MLEIVNNVCKSRKVIPHNQVIKEGGIYIGFDNQKYAVLDGVIFELNKNNVIFWTENCRNETSFHTKIADSFTIDEGVAVYNEPPDISNNEFEAFSHYEVEDKEGKFYMSFITPFVETQSVIFLDSKHRNATGLSFNNIVNFEINRRGFRIKKICTLKYTK